MNIECLRMTSFHANWVAMNFLVMTCLVGELPAVPPTSAEVDSKVTNRSPLRVPATWEYSAPLISPEDRSDEPSHAQKDPTVVYHDGLWHVFMTVKLPNRSAIE